MGLGNISKLHGQGHVTAAEQAEHEAAVWAKRVVTIPLNMQERYEYSAGNAIYAGYAPRGLASSALGWLLFKYTWSGSDMTLKQIGYDSWDNRASASYA